jgi:Histidine kinase
MNTTKSIDWSQLWYPGRKVPFTARELALAGSDGPSPTLIAVSAANIALIAFVVLLLSPPGQTARLTGMLVGLTVVAFTIGRRLWCNPWRRPLLMAMLGLALTLLVMSWLLRWRIPQRQEREAVVLVIVVCGSMLPVLLWFLTLWRAHQIEGRLRELAEREKAIEMARRLAAAQIEPHFLFNTLASVQHWVQSKDDRAAPLLAALTGYLRATLPLFDRPLLAAGRELEAVRRYLEVMQARLGTRLNWQIEVDPAVEPALLPPGLLLTLVENAIEHGIEPQLRGGTVTLTGRVAEDVVHFTISDDGAGLPAEVKEGTGLASIRERLALAAGDAAGLALSVPPEGGCWAEIHIPFRTEAQP